MKHISIGGLDVSRMRLADMGAKHGDRSRRSCARRAATPAHFAPSLDAPATSNRTAAAAALIVAGVLALHAALAQQVGARRTDLQRHDLSVAGREVIQTIVELDPGTTAPRHSHPGEEIIYVLEGTWEYTVEGQPPVTVKAGGVLSIPAGTIHSARIVGTGRGLELATYIVEKGKPLLKLAQ